jgi:energy-coupling factor transporter ATP-binding protein EcfA2
MISDPSVLVVDEPTSGLDSFIAANVMECLTSIARTGRTVIATIHQPRSEIVKTFDGLTVLAKGGALVYSGPYAHAMPWFEAQGFPLPSKSFNPADHILDVVSVDPRPGREAESAARVAGLIHAWGEQVQKVDLVEDRTPRDGQTIAAGSKITPLYIAFPVVLERMVLNLWRQREAFFNRLTQAPLLGLIFRAPPPLPLNGRTINDSYAPLDCRPAQCSSTSASRRVPPARRIASVRQTVDVSHKTIVDLIEPGAFPLPGVTLENVNSIPFVGLLNGIAIFPLDLATFKHEYSSGAAYSAGTFLLAYSVFELSMTVLAALVSRPGFHITVGCLLLTRRRHLTSYTALS